MTKSMPFAELPIARKAELPYLPTYYRASPRKLILPILLLFVGLTGVTAFTPNRQPILFALFAFVILVTVIQLSVTGTKTLKLRRATTRSLDANAEEFIQAAKTKYGVTLTQTILYQLAQGGATTLMDKNDATRRIMLNSISETKTTRLVAETI